MAKRFQREIEEILEQSGGFPKGKGSRMHNQGSIKRSRDGGSNIAALTPIRMFLGSVVLLLFALLVVNQIAPNLVSLFFWLGLALFIIAYATLIVRVGSRTERRWRGRVVEYQRQPSFREWFNRWGKR